MSGLAQLGIWNDPALHDALSWYLAVAENRRPAKFRIAATVAAEMDPPTCGEDALWTELERLTSIFLERWQTIREGAPLPPEADGPSLLELCGELAHRMLTHCNFCPWNCRVDRLAGTKFGACKLAAGSRVSSHFHHTGEELFYRGTDGSGTIFFTSCNMRCVFCQNGDISTDKDNGEETDPRTLATMAWTLRREGCHNINWVGGEVIIHLHSIVDAIALLGRDFQPTSAEIRRARRTKADGFFWFDEVSEAATYDGKFNTPILWNSNFFIAAEAMKILRVLTDVWLPDFKFGPGRCAIALARTPRYWETVTRNISLIAGWGENFTIRHLVMPNHVECCTYPVLEWIADHIPAAPVNVMAQFHPDNFCDPASTKYRGKYAEIARRPTRAELENSWRHAGELGLNFETASFERRGAFAGPALMEL
ncbi:radical SAM protein [Mesorhizobium sp. L-8-3]|uniref:radical SAM protein n=1 Tax=Mesorhizobium sp. L-8-3 TaxID=2744522 RepID=UPI001925E50B|nr:radical SAM protein [Mesorhizobium sp. L-8-3]BCH23337.1 pyruvate formate lyase-activating protein [Mesorhizobium sp. L-8-3]